MEPVVNGLEESYRDQLEFRRIDANTPEGQRAFRAFGLPGHPSFILLNPKGEILWRGFGQQPGEAIEAELEAVLSEP